VQGGVHIERHEADDRKVSAEGGDEHDEQPGGLPPGMDDGVQPTPDLGERPSHTRGEQDEGRTRGQRSEIEHGAREVAVCAQFTEMELPPVPIARRRDRDSGCEHEQCDGGHSVVVRLHTAKRRPRR